MRDIVRVPNRYWCDRSGTFGDRPRFDKAHKGGQMKNAMRLDVRRDEARWWKNNARPILPAMRSRVNTTLQTF
jgi:hypothetical protein